MPPAKDIAAVAGVNKNTALRALRELREEGVLEFRRGRGISVAGSPDRGIVVARARELAELADGLGFPPKELLEIVAEASTAAKYR